MSESESLPQVVVDEAWCEYVYPRTAIGDLNHPPPQGGFMRATRVYQLWARKHDEYWSGLLALNERKAREQTADELESLAVEMERSPKHLAVTIEDIRARAAQLREVSDVE